MAQEPSSIALVLLWEWGIRERAGRLLSRGGVATFLCGGWLSVLGRPGLGFDAGWLGVDGDDAGGGFGFVGGGSAAGP